MTIGFEITAPRGSTIKTPGSGPSPSPLGPINMADLDTTLMMADYTVNTLRDSMGLMTNEMRNLMTRLAAMEQHSKFLEDSLKAVRLNNNVDEQKMNDACVIFLGLYVIFMQVIIELHCKRLKLR